MHTLSVLVASLMTVGFNNAPDDGQSPFDYYPAHQDSMVLMASMTEPAPPQQLDLPQAAEKPYVPLKGESYYMPTCPPCQCRTPGFYAGAELTLLKPYLGGTCLDTPCFVDSGDSAVTTLMPGFDLYSAPRLTLGYMSCTGLGIRARWWRMDLHAEGTERYVNPELPTDIFTGDVAASLDAQTFDLEVTDVTVLNGKWDLMISGGVRYADLDFSRAADGTLGEGDAGVSAKNFRRSDFEGLGGTAAVELRRPWFRRVGIFANVRGSLLYGRTGGFVSRETAGITSPPRSGTEGGITRSMWEAQLGCDWTKELWHGTHLTSRIAAEAQCWDSMIGSADVGFVGMTFAVGLIR